MPRPVRLEPAVAGTRSRPVDSPNLLDSAHHIVETLRRSTGRDVDRAFGRPGTFYQLPTHIGTERPMTWISRLVLSVSLLAPVACQMNPSGDSNSVDADGLVSIFDGETLTGWEATPASTAGAWTVENGVLVGDGDKGRGYLTYTGNLSIADLEMRLSYRFPGKGNSGISIRAVPDETGKRDFKSYHADIGHLGIGRQVLGAWDFHTPGRREHACLRGDRLVIDESDNPTLTKIDGAVTEADIHKNDWNDLHIIAKGNHFQFFINGKPAAEFTEHLDPAKRLHRGMIQLQLHDPGMIVEFRDIRLKILD